MFKELFTESIQKLSDKKLDDYISKNWKKSVTLPYNFKCALELGKLGDVLVTQDKQYMHIDAKTNYYNIIKKYKLKAIDV